MQIFDAETVGNVILQNAMFNMITNGENEIRHVVVELSISGQIPGSQTTLLNIRPSRSSHLPFAAESEIQQYFYQ